MGKIKAITHVLAVAGAAAAAYVLHFAATAAGQALLHQYPFIAPFIGALGVFAAVHYNPKA